MDGWKLHQQFCYHLGDEADEVADSDSPYHPEWVHAVPHLSHDIQGLLTLLASPKPPKRLIRSNAITIALYGFGDVFGAGFGDAPISPSGVQCRYRVWGTDLHAQSLKYRELFNLTEDMEDYVANLCLSHLQNLVQSVEHDASQGLLTRAEMFLFTDNPAEGAFYKGTSTNKQQFELVLRLKQLELDFQFQLHVIHIARTRMQA
jgi:hypothetical protein